MVAQGSNLLVNEHVALVEKSKQELQLLLRVRL
jgi:hypothetical protein